MATASDDCFANSQDHTRIRPFLIHVGYHKTATTWLQDLVLLPEFGFHTVMTQDEVFAQIIAPHGLIFDPFQARETIAAASGNALSVKTVDCISLEALSGLPYYGHRESDDYAHRLAEIAPDARILITIREQCSVMASVYMQYLFRAGTAPPERFFDENPPTGYFKFSSTGYEYDRLVKLYQELFGAANVLVLPQETIAADQPAAIYSLATFAGNAPLAAERWTTARERGVSYPQAVAPILRRINHVRNGAMNPEPMIDLGTIGQLAYRGSGWLARKMPTALTRSRPVSDYVQRRFADRFCDSNCRLQALLHHSVDLTGYQGIEASGAR